MYAAGRGAFFSGEWDDPFITTLYMRHGRHQFNGMSKRDWTIFTSSVIIGNAYWTLACFMGISLVGWAWKVVAG